MWRAIEGHDELWAWMFDGPYATEAYFTEALARKEASSDPLFFAILPHSKNAAQGCCSLLRIDPNHGVIEVGHIVFAPSLQRTTAATEMIFLLARHVFEDLGYRRFEWKCNALNEPSRRAAIRFGFAFEGIFRQHMVIKGQNRDTAWFAMLDHDWPARKQAFESWLAPSNFESHGRQIRPLGEFAPE